MSRTGRTVSRQLHIESRQHELFGVDLGEGIPRKVLFIGAVAFVLWAGLVFSVTRTVNQQMMILYCLPPLLFVQVGIQESPKNPRRWRLTQLILRFRYAAWAHRPVIRFGRRAADRHEFLPLTDRIGGKLGQTIARIRPEHAESGEGQQAAVSISPTAWVIGGDALDDIGSREIARRKNKKKRRR